MGVGQVYEIEPNNTASTANSIALGSSATGQLSSRSDVDYYAVNITSAGILTTNFTAPAGYSDYTINIYNGSSTLLSSWSTSKSDSYQLGVALTGTYYVAVTGAYNTGQYTVALSATSSTPDNPSATYGASAGSSSVNEGSIAIFTLTTTNVTAGTVVPYTISGVTSADIVGGAMSGNATVGANGQATITVSLAADNLTEGSETLTVTAGGASASTTVNDTSKMSAATYSISTATSSVNEGSIAIFTLTTTNVTAGTVVPYTISGVTSADIVGGAMSGNATVGANGQATISVALFADRLTEGAETLTVTAHGKTASTTVSDTSITLNSQPPSVTANNLSGITYIDALVSDYRWSSKDLTTSLTFSFPWKDGNIAYFSGPYSGADYSRLRTH